MSNLRHLTTKFADNQDDIKTTGVLNMMVLDIMINGKTHIVHLLSIKRMGWINDIPVVAGLHLYKDRGITILGNYINVAMPGMPVTS